MTILGALGLAAVAAAALSPAQAGLAPDVLSTAAAAPKTDAQLPLALRFTDQEGAARTLADAIGGRATVLIFADYTCRTLCGPILEFATAGLETSGLAPGRDYRLVVIGLNPRDGAAQAREMRARTIGSSPVASAASLLSADQPTIAAAAQAVGYSYAYDPARDQFAHPAAAYILTPQGTVARVLSGLGLDGADLRLALVEAGRGKIGTIVDRIRLLCYGFDSTQGIYTESIERWLTALASFTVTALIGWIALLTRLARRRST